MPCCGYTTYAVQAQGAYDKKRIDGINLVPLQSQKKGT